MNKARSLFHFGNVMVRLTASATDVGSDAAFTQSGGSRIVMRLAPGKSLISFKSTLE